MTGEPKTELAIQSLHARTAIIVGAAGAIGGAIATLFARAGASLCLADQNTGALDDIGARCRKLGAAVELVGVDAVSEESVNAMVARCLDRFGAVDILVNSAGAISEVWVRDMSLAEWQRIVQQNLESIFLACRAVLPSMRQRKWGRIINIASQVGQKGGVGFAHYAAAKAGVIGFTKALAREVAPEGILANTIAPGPIDTPFVGSLSAETLQQKQRELPLGRSGQADEVAPTALLLASDPGGNLYVGQTLGPNSGDVML